jgi:hypothetical protein
VHRVPYKAQYIGGHADDLLTVPSPNHFNTAKVPGKTASQIKQAGLQRVAGNVFICPSTQAFWKLQDDGKLLRITTTEVDLGDQIAPAPAADPEAYLNSALADLEF